jgi:hypothetical protein
LKKEILVKIVIDLFVVNRLWQKHLEEADARYMKWKENKLKVNPSINSNETITIAESKSILFEFMF